MLGRLPIDLLGVPEWTRWGLSDPAGGRTEAALDVGVEEDVRGLQIAISLPHQYDHHRLLAEGH